VEEYFAWGKERLEDKSCLPKGKTAQGLKYSVNQEVYLKSISGERKRLD
jgi:hypothetical protein